MDNNNNFAKTVSWLNMDRWSQNGLPATNQADEVDLTNVNGPALVALPELDEIDSETEFKNRIALEEKEAEEQQKQQQEEEVKRRKRGRPPIESSTQKQAQEIMARIEKDLQGDTTAQFVQFNTRSITGGAGTGSVTAPSTPAHGQMDNNNNRIDEDDALQREAQEMILRRGGRILPPPKPRTPRVRRQKQDAGQANADEVPVAPIESVFENMPIVSSFEEQQQQQQKSAKSAENMNRAPTQKPAQITEHCHPPLPVPKPQVAAATLTKPPAVPVPEQPQQQSIQPSKPKKLMMNMDDLDDDVVMSDLRLVKQKKPAAVKRPASSGGATAAAAKKPRSSTKSSFLSSMLGIQHSPAAPQPIANSSGNVQQSLAAPSPPIAKKRLKKSVTTTTTTMSADANALPLTARENDEQEQKAEKKRQEREAIKLKRKREQRRKKGLVDSDDEAQEEIKRQKRQEMNRKRQADKPATLMNHPNRNNITYARSISKATNSIHKGLALYPNKTGWFIGERSPAKDFVMTAPSAPKTGQQFVDCATEALRALINNTIAIKECYHKMIAEGFGSLKQNEIKNMYVMIEASEILSHLMDPLVSITVENSDLPAFQVNRDVDTKRVISEIYVIDTPYLKRIRNDLEDLFQEQGQLVPTNPIEEYYHQQQQQDGGATGAVDNPDSEVVTIALQEKQKEEEEERRQKAQQEEAYRRHLEEKKKQEELLQQFQSKRMMQLNATEEGKLEKLAAPTTAFLSSFKEDSKLPASSLSEFFKKEIGTVFNKTFQVSISFIANAQQQQNVQIK